MSLEIVAEIPDGFPEHVVQTVRKNWQTFKFCLNELQGDR